MSEQNPTAFPTPFNAVMPTVLVVALSGLSYLLLTSSLESRRPKLGNSAEQTPPPVSAPGLATTFSRLWQDPLEGVSSQNSPLEVSSTISSKRDDESGLDATAAATNDAARHMSGRITNVLDTDKDARVLCMPVMVPGGPYVESREQRRRTRYALLSALGDAGYTLVHPERMSFMKVRIDVKTALKTPHRRIDLVVPIKTHYRSSIGTAHQGKTKTADREAPATNDHQRNDVNHSNRNATTDSAESQTPKYAAVIVLWINESQLGMHPLSAMSQIIEQVFSQVDGSPKKVAGRTLGYYKSIDIAMIGPSSSDVLLSLARDNSNWPKKSRIRTAPQPYETLKYFSTGRFHKARLYSPRASVAQQSLSTDGWNRQSHLSEFMRTAMCRSGIEPVRTGGDDAGLVKALEKELRLRGAWPQPPKQRPWPSQNHMVLITERDTLYGQAFRKVFEDQVKQTVDSSRRLHHFTYLRGTDGQYPRSDELEDLPRQRHSEAENLRQATAGAMAHGAGQFDYIHRMAQEIGELRQRLRKDHNGDIKAIGVVGTDVYDKLMILRALRPHFPAARFFTTDLDARLADDEELPYTRNLLVASHFALEVDQETFGRTVLRFRDSSQTATYFSVRLAIDHDNRAWKQGLNQTDPWGLAAGPPSLEPLMFEIGRGGPYLLTNRKDRPVDSATVNPGLAIQTQHLVGIANETAAATRGDGSIHPPRPRDSRDWPSGRWLCWFYFSSGVLVAVAVLALLAGNDELRKRCWARVITAFATLNETLKQRGDKSSDPGTQEKGNVLIAAIRDAAKIFKACYSGLKHLVRMLNTSFKWLLPVIVVAFLCVAAIALSATGSYPPQLVPAAFVVFFTAFTLMHVGNANDEPEEEKGVEEKSSSPLPTVQWIIGAAVAAAGVLLSILIVFDHQNPQGQPFDFTSGISVWPPSLIRYAAMVLAVIFIGHAIRRLAESEKKIGEYCGITVGLSHPANFRQKTLKKTGHSWAHGTVSGIKATILYWKHLFPAWFSDNHLKNNKTHLNPTQVCESYLKYEHHDARFLRVAMGTVVLFALLIAILHSTEYPAISYRGGVSYCTATTILYASSLLVMFVILLTLDALLACQRFVKRMSVNPVCWQTGVADGCCQQEENKPKKTLFDEERELRGWRSLRAELKDGERKAAPSDANEAAAGIARATGEKLCGEALGELVTIRLIAERSEAVSGLIYLPFLLLAVMLLARHHLVDTSYLPPAAIFAIGGFLLALLAAAIFLRLTASQAKQCILERLQQHHSKACSGGLQPYEKQVTIIIADVLAERRGAFRPLSDDPLLGALAVPSALAAGLLGLERYLLQ